ncbi:hypothetical protein TNCV_396341 [Trichonephila clavipes]|nr:hypothetical protein TNCV_396341 [Trichonephila clavipes]
MFDSSSFVNPTPLAHADISRDVLPRGGTSQRHEFESNTTKDPASTRRPLEMDLVVLNHGQVTRTASELEPNSPNYHTNGRTFELLTDLTCIAPLHGGSLVVLGSNS